MGKRKWKHNQPDADELEVLKRQLQKARNKGDFKEVSNLHNQIGVVYRELQQYEDALQEHEEEANITLRYFPNDKVGLGVAYRAKGEVYLELKEEAKALPLVKEFLRLSREVNDLVEEQRAHITLGRVYLALAIKYAEEGGSDKAKNKGLDRAEREFEIARDLCNHTKVKAQLPESGLIDMKCGVIFNIAIVLDMKEKTEDSIRYTLKALELAKRNSLYEHLYRANIHLFEIYAKQKKYKEAKDAAIEAAKAGKSLDNFTFEAESRVLEAKMYFMTNEIELGVKILKKIRKHVKSKKVAESVLENLEPLLKAAVQIMRTEDTLHLTGRNEFDKRRKLYECIADNYVEIGNYADSVTNYELSIENAISARTCDSELAKLYYSLAITLKDMGEDTSALKYFQKEIALHSHNPIEAFKTQTNITACMEKAGTPEAEILAAHEKAISLAKASGSHKKEISALINYSLYLKSISRYQEADEILDKIKQIRLEHGLSEDSEERDSQDLLDGEDGEAETDERNANDSVDLDNLTSDDDQTDEEDKEHGANEVVQKKKKFRVNEKGETPLHVAAKKGDIKTLRRLIRQGHEINPRDSAGWIPLHEACNFGNVEVVEELLKYGARVNDQPAGRDCDKITPIHDAANNGHIAVMKALIDHGANVLLKDAHGNYPIDCLIVCRERVKAAGDAVDEEELHSYYEMKNLLKSLMLKGGKPYEKRDEKKARKKAKVDIDDGPKFELMHSTRIKHAGPVPVTVAVDDFDPDDGNDAVDLYSSTISGLRRKNKGRRKPRHSDDEDEHPISPEEPKQALIAESQYVDDDWLDDDMGTGKRNKRKRGPLAVDSDEGEGDHYEFSRLRPNHRPETINSDERIRSGNRSINRTSTVDSEDSAGNGFARGRPSNLQLLVDSDESSCHEFSRVRPNNRTASCTDLPSSSTSTGTGYKSRIIQVDSDDDGDEVQEVSRFPELITRPLSFSDLSSKLTENRRSSPKKKRKPIQTKLPFKPISSSSLSLGDNSSDGSSSSTRQTETHASKISKVSPRTGINTSSVLRLKIQIGEKTYVVPVMENQLDFTIEWLRDECARRYFEANGLQPVLSLSTKDGAILSGTDVIRVVLTGNETELVANVTSYDVPRIVERFKTALTKIPELVCDDDLLRALDECQASNSLVMTDQCLKEQVGQLVFKSLQCQFTLRELYLSGCSLYDEGLSHLAAVIPSLSSMIVLDVSCNGITAGGLSKLSESLLKKPDNLVVDRSQGLTSLNLSYNSIGNSAGSVLTDMLSHLSHLRRLFIADCDFSVRILSESRLSNAFKKLRLEELDISYNEWGKTGLETIRQSLSELSMITLTCDSCSIEDEDEFMDLI